jgi:hypothetical protein
MRVDDATCNSSGPGKNRVPRHGCRITEETRVQMRFDDMAGHMYQALSHGVFDPCLSN